MSRPARPLLWRLAPVAVALASVAAVSWWCGPHDVELLVRVPPSDTDIQGLTLRLAREDGREVLRAWRPKSAGPGRTVVFRSPVPRGVFRVEAWGEPGSRPYTGRIVAGDEESIELDLTAR